MVVLRGDRTDALALIHPLRASELDRVRALLTLPRFSGCDGGEGRLTRKLEQWSRFDVVALDELGCVLFGKSGADQLVGVITKTYERRGLIVTTSLPLARWTEVILDATAGTAVIDRITHHATIPKAVGKSCTQHDIEARRSNRGAKLRCGECPRFAILIPLEPHLPGRCPGTPRRASACSKAGNARLPEEAGLPPPEHPHGTATRESLLECPRVAFLADRRRSSCRLAGNPNLT